VAVVPGGICPKWHLSQVAVVYDNISTADSCCLENIVYKHRLLNSS